MLGHCSHHPLPASIALHRLLMALAYADDAENDREHSAKRDDGLCVHGRHLLSELPEGGEAPPGPL